MLFAYVSILSWSIYCLYLQTKTVQRNYYCLHFGLVTIIFRRWLHESSVLLISRWHLLLIGLFCSLDIASTSSHLPTIKVKITIFVVHFCLLLDHALPHHQLLIIIFCLPILFTHYNFHFSTSN